MAVQDQRVTMVWTKICESCWSATPLQCTCYVGACGQYKHVKGQECHWVETWELIFSFDTSRVIETGFSTFCFLTVCERFRFLLFPRWPQLAVKYKILALCCLPTILLPQHTAPVSSQQQRRFWPTYSWQRKKTADQCLRDKKSYIRSVFWMSLL